MASTPYCFFIGVRRLSTSLLCKLSHSTKWAVQVMDCTPIDMKGNARWGFITKAAAFGKGQYTCVDLMMKFQGFEGLYGFSGLNKLSTRAGKIQDLESPEDIRDGISKDTPVSEDEDNIVITDKDLRYNKGLIEARDIWLQMEKLEDEYEELFTVDSFKKLAEENTDSEEDVSEDSDSSSEDTHSRSEKHRKYHMASRKISDTESNSDSEDTSFGDLDRRFDSFDFD
eukprot:c23347_g1_i2 orf=220-900(+)